MSGYNRDKAAQQLPKSVNPLHRDAAATNPAGIPMASLTESLTVGPRGNILLQDVNLMDHLAHFDRERISERLVHAKGNGAFGYFEVTKDITHWCRAKMFEHVGKRTRIAIRISMNARELGSGDTIRSHRGFAVKFYTQEGNWDVAGLSTPIFQIRQPILFHTLNHVAHRNPVTHLKDDNMNWDFLTSFPEAIHAIMFLYSDRGIPDGYRHMHGFGSHAYKFVNDKNEAVYVKLHFRTDQGIKNLTVEEANKIHGVDLDYGGRDLYNAIANGNYPSWTFCIQVMTFEQAEKYRWNPFDLTKVWLYEDFPLIPIGKIVLNENVSNYFNDVEQIAFAPSQLVPGVEPSPDKILQARLFAYIDIQRYRVGANHLQLPINRPICPVNTYDRDGPMCYVDPGQGPNYFPNSFGGPTINHVGRQSSFPQAGDVTRYNTEDDDNYSQPTLFWERCVDEGGRQRLVDSIAVELQNTVKKIQDKAVSNFTKVHPDFGIMLQQALIERQKVKPETPS